MLTVKSRDKGLGTAGTTGEQKDQQFNNTFHSRLTSSQHANANVVYTPLQIKDFLNESVREFIEIYKTAVFKFYKIRSYKRS